MFNKLVSPGNTECNYVLNEDVRILSLLKSLCIKEKPVCLWCLFQELYPSRSVLWNLWYTYMTARTTSRNCIEHFIDIFNNRGTLVGPTEIAGLSKKWRVVKLYIFIWWCIFGPDMVNSVVTHMLICFSYSILFLSSVLLSLVWRNPPMLWFQVIREM